MANIHPDAKIGKDVEISPFVTIEDDVEIGDNTKIGPNAVLMSGTRVGKNCEIFPGAVLGAIPQDLKFVGEYSTVQIGDNTTIREYVTVNRGTKDKETTVVGSNCLLMAYVHVAHDCIIGNNVIIANYCGLAGHCVVGDWAIIEGYGAVQQFIHIGAHSFIAGGSLVRKNVPPFVKAAREPLTYAGVNTIGMRRRGYTDEQIMAVEDIYRVIYVQNSNITSALKIVDVELPASDQKDEIINFIKGSTKGIIRGLS